MSATLIEPTSIEVDQRARIHFEPEFIDLGDGYFALAAGPEILAASVPAQIAHPLGPPTVTGTSITVDTMLKQPTRITRMIGKVWISDEARDRNDATLFTNQLRQLGNTIVRKINARAIQVLEAMFTAYPSRVVVSKSQGVGGWDAVTPYGGTPTAPGAWPAADFAMAAEIAETDELGIRYDLWIINPGNYTDLLLLYGGDGIQELLSTLGIEVYVSTRVPLNTAYVVASGQVGQMRTEQALGTETWREPNRQRTWVQSSARPLMFCDNRFAALKVTNLKG
jgi:hypothetical protein